MFVICKRAILFIDEQQFREGARAPRQHLVPFSKDVQQIPDWVGEQSAFKTAMKDDTVQVVEVKSPAPAIVKEIPKPPLDLQKLSKDELVAHAQEVHGLELDERLKKDEMIAAIQDAAAAR